MSQRHNRLARVNRLFRHLTLPPWQLERVFPAHSMRAIERAIQVSETKHSGQIFFLLECRCGIPALLGGQTPRQRALELFSLNRVWDTEHNNGVFIYVCLADRDVEIVADRGIHQHVGAAGWEAICKEMETCFRNAAFEEGVILGITKIGERLSEHFPATGPQRDELPNQPVVL